MILAIINIADTDIDAIKYMIFLVVSSSSGMTGPKVSLSFIGSLINGDGEFVIIGSYLSPGNKSFFGPKPHSQFREWVKSVCIHSSQLWRLNPFGLD